MLEYKYIRCEKSISSLSLHAKSNKSKRSALRQKFTIQATSSTKMAASYPGAIPKWLEDNRAFATEVFPSLPQPWKMDQRWFLAKESGKATLVRESLRPKSIGLSRESH